MTNDEKIAILQTALSFIQYAIKHLEKGTDPDYDIWSAMRFLNYVNRG